MPALLAELHLEVIASVVKDAALVTHLENLGAIPEAAALVSPDQDHAALQPVDSVEHAEKITIITEEQHLEAMDSVVKDVVALQSLARVAHMAFLAVHLHPNHLLADQKVAQQANALLTNSKLLIY